MTSMAANYPIQLAVDPTAAQGRWGVFFRIILAIPHLIILCFLGIAQFVITFLAWFAIMFTGRYPAGMLGFSIGATRWQARANAYMSLLTGVYPPFSLDAEDDYPIRLMVTEQIEGRNRLTTFFRIFLIIPHYIILYFLGIVSFFVMVIAWFAALITGQVPQGLHNFLAGVTRWDTRLGGYWMLLVDEHPPYGFD